MHLLPITEGTEELNGIPFAWRLNDQLERRYMFFDETHNYNCEDFEYWYADINEAAEAMTEYASTL